MLRILLGVRMLGVLNRVRMRRMVTRQGVRVRVWGRVFKQQAVCVWVRVGLEVWVVWVWGRVTVEIALRSVCHVGV